MSSLGRPWLIRAVVIFLIVLFQTLNFFKRLVQPVVRLFFAGRVPHVVRTPEECFSGLDRLGYNFAPNYVEFPAGGGVNLPRMHYVDEGDKKSPAILCLHGEPSWSFLYRHMVPILTNAGYRVVVPDFIGFGKSDKYTSMENYTHEMHTSCLRMLIDHLKLKDITLVCQDWGGLTGLSVVKDMPDSFSALVLMNTGLPDGSQPGGFAKVLPFVLWRSFVAFCGHALPIGFIFGKVSKFPSATCLGYTAPFPGLLYKAGAAKWPLLVPLFKDDAVSTHMNDAKNCLRVWRKPALIMFGDSDPITRGLDQVFMKLIGNSAKILTVHGAGHFLQETHGPELASNIISFLNKG